MRPKTRAPRLVAVDLDGNDSHPGLELDDAALERGREHPGGPEDRVAGEGHLRARVEDPDARVTARLRREGRTSSRRSRSPARAPASSPSSIPRASVKTASWLPASARVREDVDDDVAQRRHGAHPTPATRGAYRLRPCRPPSSSRICASPTETPRPFAASASRSRRARSSGCSGRTAPARRRRSRSSRGIAGVTAATRPCSGTIPATRRARCESGSASFSSSRSSARLLTVRETHRMFAGYYAQPARRRRGDRPRRAR